MNTLTNLHSRLTSALRRALGSPARDAVQTGLEIGLSLGATASAVLALNLFPDDSDEPLLRLAPSVACAALALGSALLFAGQIWLDRRATREWHQVKAFANDALDHASRTGAAGRPMLDTAVDRLEAWAAIDGPWMSAGSRRVILGHIDDLRASAEHWGTRRAT